MAEPALIGFSSSDSWRIQWQEANRSFYQALNRIRVQQGVPPVNHHSDPIEKLLNDRTIFVKIWNESYPVSCEIFYSIFSGFGILIGIERLSKGFHSAVCLFEKEAAIRAFESLNGRNIYDNCCQLELFLVASAGSSSEIVADVEVGNRTSEFQGAPIEDDGDCHEEVEPPDSNANQIDDSSVNVNQVEPLELFLATSMESSSADQGNATLEENEVASPVAKNYIELGEDPNKLLRVEVIANSIEDMNQVIKQHPQDLHIRSKSSMEVELRKTSKPDDDGDIEEPHTQQRQFEVNLDLSEFIIDDGAIKELSDLVNLLIELLEIKMENFRMISIECLGHLSARKVFEKMPHRKEALYDLHEHNLVEDWLILFPFDRGKAFAIPIDQESIKWPYDKGKGSSSNSPLLVLVDSFCEHHNHVSSLSFDRGRVFDAFIRCVSAATSESGGCSFVFDPGIASVSIGLGVYRRVVKLVTGLGIQLKYSVVTWPYNRGKETVFTCSWRIKIDVFVA